MHVLLVYVAVSLLLFASAPALPCAAQAHFPSDSVVRANVERVFQPGDSDGIVVGLLDADGTRRVVTVGSAHYDGRTLFEIGSITKVLTGIVLAEMAVRGEVRVDQPVVELLPAGVTVPSRGGRQITLVDLSTHSSGLPRMPDNFAPADWSNPYVDYTPEQLYDFLRRHELRRDIGAQGEYSNLGVGLLGHALALRASMTYEALVTERVLVPLGMTATVVTIPDSLRHRLAPGHNASGRRVGNWDLITLAGAGALRSTADDMLTFLAANVEPPPSTLGRAIRRSHALHFRRTPTEGNGLGWGVNTTRFGRHVIGHGGGTAGYRTYASFDPERHIGVVVLSNHAGVDVARIGAHLLDPRYPPSTRGLESAFRYMAATLALLLVAGVLVAWRRTGATWGRAWLAAALTATGAFVWLTATLVAAGFGVLRFDTTPPTMVVVVIAIVALSVGLARSRVGARLARGLPLAILVAAQGFRLPLELMMHRAYEHGLMPVQMSYSGLNLDVVTGALALVVGVLVAAGRAGLRTVRMWNLLGTLLLLNIIVISWLSAPTPLRAFHNPPANSWITTAPYIWLPAVMVTFAMLGHLVIFRRLRLETQSR